MVSPQRLSEENSSQVSKPHPSDAARLFVAIGLGIALVLTIIGYVLFSGHGASLPPFSGRTSTNHTKAAESVSSSSSLKPDVALTRESVDLLLDALDRAIRQKDIEGVLRHIAPDATIAIHMRQGSQQQTAMLTHEEYRKALAMSFAFPSANDFARVSTNVTLAADGRSAKVSFKSTETLLQAERAIKVDGEESLVLIVRDQEPTIISLEKIVPGDSN